MHDSTESHICLRNKWNYVTIIVIIVVGCKSLLNNKLCKFA